MSCTTCHHRLEGQAAIDLGGEGLRIVEERDGRDHGNVAAVVVSLGKAHLDLGDAAQARDMLQRALAIMEREYGPGHPNVAATLKLLEKASARSLPAAAAPKARSKATAKDARKASPAESLKGPPVQKAVSKKAREGSKQK